MYAVFEIVATTENPFLFIHTSRRSLRCYHTAEDCCRCQPGPSKRCGWYGCSCARRGGDRVVDAHLPADDLESSCPSRAPRHPELGLVRAERVHEVRRGQRRGAPEDDRERGLESKGRRWWVSRARSVLLGWGQGTHAFSRESRAEASGDVDRILAARVGAQPGCESRFK